MDALKKATRKNLNFAGNFYKNRHTVKLLIEPHGALLEGVNDCSFKNRV